MAEQPTQEKRQIQKRKWENQRHKVMLSQENWKMWTDIKTEIRAASNDQVASAVLGAWRKMNQKMTVTQNAEYGTVSSTPLLTILPRPRMQSIDVSDISDRSDGGELGIVTMADLEDPLHCSLMGRTSKDAKETEQSYIEVSYEVEEDRKDVTYVPGTSDEDSDEYEDDSDEFEEFEMVMSLRQKDEEDIYQLPMRTAGDVIFDVDSDAEDVGSSDEEQEIEEVVRDVVGEKKAIAFEMNLLDLASVTVAKICQVKGCGGDIRVECSYIGTAVQLKWVCTKRHLIRRWYSQPKVNKRMTGDILISSAILTSGNNFEKVKLMFKFFGMGLTARTTHYNVQGKHAVPVISRHFTQMISANLTKYNGVNIIVAGDGRMDSPGYSAQYCTYTLMEYETKDIVACEIVDKRMTSFKSTAMEKEGLLRAISKLKDNGVGLQELCTDASSTISALLKNDYPTVTHSYDTWHGAKNFGKKLGSVAAEKKNKELRVWVPDLVNHFWYCSRTAAGNELVFLARWRSILHHVVNVHEWALGDGAIAAECEHGDISGSDEKWLEPGSDPHMALTRVILDTRMLHTLKYYINFRHTGELETFHEHILMYCAKRFAYSYPLYKARNQLAVIDYQFHKDRANLINKNGEPRLHRAYSKKNGNWSCYAEKEPKTYAYMPGLMADILNDFNKSQEKLTRKAALSPSDPRLIHKTIAPTSPPPTKQLMEMKKSRFTDNNV